MKNNKVEEIRIPRPLGLTMAMNQILKDPDPTKTKETNIKKLIVKTWMLNGQTLHNRVYNITQLSYYLNTNPEDIQILINSTMKDIGMVLDDGNFKDLSRVLFSQALNLGSESASLAGHQARLMMASQGDVYQPFMSNVVNQAIANYGASIKPLLGLLDILKAPLANVQDPNNPNQKHTITPDEAIQILRQEQKSVLEDPNTLDAEFEILKGTHEASGTPIPEVGARYQDLKEIGIKQAALPDSSAQPVGPIKVPTATDIKVPPTTGKARENTTKEGRIRRESIHIVEDAGAEDFVS